MPILERSPKIARGEANRWSRASSFAAQANAEDPRWQLARRIAASRTLGRSRLMAEFLLYIVDRHIRDRADEITEQQIGVLVFGRAEGYDANEDNIVRSYARNLRKRLDEYFGTEGKDEELLLEIPRGGYAPVFSVRTVEENLRTESFVVEEPVPSPSAEVNDLPKSSQDENLQPQPSLPIHRLETRGSISIENGPAEERRGHRKYSPVLVLCIGIALGLGCSFLQPLRLIKHLSASPAETASSKLWAELFTRDRDTFIVPSDDGLIIMQGLTQRPVPLADYISGNYRMNLKTDNDPAAPEIIKLGKRRYTSVVDLQLVHRLGQLEQVVPERMIVRYARDVRMDDLRTGNAILIGSSEANPWIELFQPRMNFRLSIHAGTDKPSGIANSHPQPGEKEIYGTPGPDHTYGLIAYVPNLTSTGHVLIVGGLNTAGTEAAATFLLTPSLLGPVLQRAKAHNGLQQFELLIGSDNVATHASTPQLITERIGSP